MDQNPLFLSDHYPNSMYPPSFRTNGNHMIDDNNNNNDNQSNNDDDDDDDDDEIFDDDDDDENDDESYWQWVASSSSSSLENHSNRIRHIRCIYRCMTFPILPCIFITILAYFYFLFTAFLLDNNANNNFPNYSTWWKWWYQPNDNDGRISTNDPSIPSSDTNEEWTDSIVNHESLSSSTSTPCAQPLHVYAYISVLIALYMYFHRTIRTMILTRTWNLRSTTRTLPPTEQQRHNHSNDRATETNHRNVDPDQYIVPFLQQRYDQIVYSLIIVYICVGLSFVQSCRTVGSGSTSGTTTTSTNTVEPSYSPDDDPNWNDVTSFSSSSSSMSTCQVTCPYIFQALTIYISMIELTILAYIIPMLCLPCIYFYLLRHGSDSNNNNNRNDIQRNYNPSFMIDPETFIRLLNGRTTNENHETPPPQTTLDRFTTMTHPFLFGSYYHYTYHTNHTVMGTNRMTTTNRRRWSHRNRKLRVQDIVRQFEVVQLSKQRKIDRKLLYRNDTISLKYPNDDMDDVDDDDKVEIVISLDDSTATKKEKIHTSRRIIEVLDSSSLECCICMNEFMVEDVENGQCPLDADESAKIVRTPICHHLFHQHCIQNWMVGGQWWEDGRNTTTDDRNDMNNHDDNGSFTVTSHLLSQPPRQSHRNPPILASRTTCPLCRANLYTPSLLQQEQRQQPQNYGSTS